MLTTCGDIDVAWFEVGRGQPLILVHGLADDHRAWRRTIPALMMQRRVLLYDFRGHGETSLGAADGTLRQLGDDLIALMDAIGIEHATLAGFSLGGTIAMRAAIDHPSRVAALALVATSSRVGRAASDWYQARTHMVVSGAEGLRETLDGDTADVYRNQPRQLGDGLAIRRQSTRDPRGYGNACRAMAGLHAAPLDPELGSISAPTVIVAGDKDQHCPPRASVLIAAGIPHSRMTVIADAGHPIPVEKPEELATLILGAADTP